MASKQELFTKVTGLTFDVEKITDEKKLTWLIPDGAMLNSNENNRKAKETKEFMAAAGLDEDSKFSTIDIDYDPDDEPEDDDSSDDMIDD